MEFSVSPNVTKLVIAYETVNGSTGLIAKNIDFTQDSASDMVFDNRVDFEGLIVGLNSSEICIGDKFMVIRNGSKFRMNNLQKRALQIGYRFSGDNVTFLDSRDISANIPVNGTYN